MWKTLREDINVVFDQDPAARNKFEVILTYAGVHAVWAHRLAHWFWQKHLLLIAQIISQFSRFMTGIEIHPGAKIGHRFFIDHGMGVVIGETTEIGDNVTIYQGVTLGGTGKEQNKRHPTLEDNVMVSTGAKVLGSITIGENAKVGGGAVVLNDVPPHSTVVGIPGYVVKQNGVRIQRDLDQSFPDPLKEKRQEMEQEIIDLRQEVESLKGVQRDDDSSV